ncbi:MAG TPA: hypothetical protein PLI71_09495 [Clostridia bacterium]|nr:hypothetical protein [Clostridia bacterium]
MELIDKVRTQIMERVRSEFHNLPPIYQRYLRNKWEAEEQNISSSTQNITIYRYEAEGEPVPSSPASPLPAVDLQPYPFPPGRTGFPPSGEADTPSTTSSSPILSLHSPTPQPPPVYTPLESNRKLESLREPEAGEIIFIRLDTPCYVCGSFEFWEFLNEGCFDYGSHFKEVIRRCCVCHPPVQDGKYPKKER